MCKIITMEWRLARGVTPNIARSHPKYCKESPQILQGVTPNIARSHPKYCKESPQILQRVTPNIARSHPKYCKESPQILQGVTPNIARSHPKYCKESPQPLWGVTPTTVRSHPNHCEESPYRWRDGASPVFFLNNSVSDVIQLRVLVVHEGHSYGTLPTLKNWRFHLLLFSCYIKCEENARSHADQRMLHIWMAFDRTDSTIHVVMYIVLSIFTDLKLECIIGLPFCGSKLGDYSDSDSLSNAQFRRCSKPINRTITT